MSGLKVIKGILILFLFCLLLNIPYIHLREFQGEEGRRVIVAENMLRTGEWIVPIAENVPYLKKPPLYNWILTGGFWITGTVSETTARLPSALSAFLSALCLSLFWRSAAKIKDLWFILPGLIFLSFTDVMDKAIRAEIDMTFTMLITLAIFLWFHLHEVRQKHTLAWVSALFLLSIATLAKGMQAPAFFYFGIIPYLIYRKEMKRIFSISHLLGILTALVIFFAWFIPFTEKIGVENVLQAWWHEIAVRQEPIRAGGFFRHLLEFPIQYIAAYMPWIPFALLWTNKSLRERATGYQRIVVYCLFFLLFSIPFYWILPGARLRYIMPVSGALALLLTVPIHIWINRDFVKHPWANRYIRALGFLLIGCVLSSPFWGGEFGLFKRAIPVFLLGTVFFLSVSLVFAGENIRKSMALLLLTVLSVKVSWASLYFPYHAEHLSHYRTAAREINILVPPGVHLYDFNVDNSHLAYYLHRPVTLIRLLDKATIKNSAVVLMRKKDAEKLDLRGFSYVGEVKARRDFLSIYKVVNRDGSLEN
jgi:4-amino-4-deoxy-L-arabinose transferase-like glycosyltransferase